jgi:hypothetical protein
MTNEAQGSSTAAYVDFLYRAILEARMLAYRSAPHAQIADLMDAIHNVPSRVHGRADWDESLFVGTLAEYDRKWAGSDESANLMAMFDGARDRYR